MIPPLPNQIGVVALAVKADEAFNLDSTLGALRWSP
jgi:hypothetical protein